MTWCALALHRYQQEHRSYRIDVRQNKQTREAVRKVFCGPTAAVGSVLEVYNAAAGVPAEHAGGAASTACAPAAAAAAAEAPQGAGAAAEAAADE